MKEFHQMPEQLANVQGAASIGLAITSWLTDLELWLQIGATVAAIAVGITASLWNIEKYRAAKAERKRNAKAFKSSESKPTESAD